VDGRDRFVVFAPRVRGIEARGVERRRPRVRRIVIVWGVPTPAAEITDSRKSRATQPREGHDPSREREGEHQQDPRLATPRASLGVAGGPEARARGGAHVELLVGTRCLFFRFVRRCDEHVSFLLSTTNGPKSSPLPPRDRRRRVPRRAAMA